MWRKRKWDGRSPKRVSRAHNLDQWKRGEYYVKNLSCGQHIKYASGCLRGLDLHWDYFVWVFQRYGLSCFYDGWLNNPVGGGSMRNIRMIGANASLERLSSQSIIQTCILLWKSWMSYLLWISKMRRLNYHSWRCVATRRRLRGSSDNLHHVNRSSLLGIRQKAGLKKALSLSKLVIIVLKLLWCAGGIFLIHWPWVRYFKSHIQKHFAARGKSQWYCLVSGKGLFVWGSKMRSGSG